MSLYLPQFKNLIEKTLKETVPALYSASAVNLLLGTAAQESHFGKYIRQLNDGPALGVFQMERPTFEWLKRTYPNNLRNINFEDLEWNLKAAIISARLRYWVVPEPLPNEYDIGGLAKYWKKYYNTYLGSGTEEEFINNYHKYIG